MLTKKYYEGIAAALLKGMAQREVWVAVADYLGTDNPRFNREKFLDVYFATENEQKRWLKIAAE